MKNLKFFKLSLILSLISNILSYGVMFGPYAKDSFASSRDNSRFSKAYNLATKRIIDKNGGSENAAVFPIAIYHQLVNGLNYKIITAVRDEKNKKVNLVNSVVCSGSFSNTEPVEPTLTFQEKIPDMFNVEITSDNEILFIQNSIVKLYSNTLSSILAFNSIVKVAGLLDEESFYSVNVSIISEGKKMSRFYILNFHPDKGLEVMHTFDFDA